MEYKELNSRADIDLLVRTFYGKVREDDLIGPVFNNQVNDWEKHLERLIDFWETNLLFVPKYKGRPAQVHIKVDRANDNKITQMHFGRWLQLWFETIENHFVGERADLAKRRARLMSTHFFLKIYSSREAQK